MMWNILRHLSRSKWAILKRTAHITGMSVVVLLLYHYSLHSRAVKLPDSARPNNTAYAYATFLSSRVTNTPIELDPYVLATRVLIYQLLNSPKTKTRKGIPLVIMVPGHVPDSIIDSLISDGATVKRVENLLPEHWTPDPARSAWIDQFAKLRIFELVEYERILYMDNDMLITKCLDEIFDEDEVRIESITRNNTERMLKDEGALPDNYVLAAAGDQEGPEGERPKKIHNFSQLSGGFFVLKPSSEAFKYYNSVLQIGGDGRFNTPMMEMGLLNYAHRFWGNMPWTPLPPGKWNSNWPSWRDYERGTASLHDKFWDPSSLEWIDQRLVDMWWAVKAEMDVFWEGKRNSL